MSSSIAVLEVRRRIWANGFRPIAVRSGAKAPIADRWTERARGNPPDDADTWPSPAAFNTGILCDGLIAIDIDIDDPSLASQIISAAWNALGPAPSRIRDNSPRCLLLYRAAEGEPCKRSLPGSRGKVELLGRGQQFVAYGLHESGAAYEWPHSGPDVFTREQLTPVAESSVIAFLRIAAELMGAECPTSPATPPRAISASAAATDRDCEYARAALQSEVERLRGMQAGSGRNNALNQSAFVMGTLIANGSIEANDVAFALFDAAIANGYVSKDGEPEAKRTIESGINSGLSKPRPLLGSAINIDLSALIPKQQSKQSNIATRTVELVRGAEIEAKPIHWLWEGFLPSGKLTLLAGAGGTGKSTLAFNMAATITRGGLWPDGTQCRVMGNVLIWSSEDDPADTIKPRMMAVNADPLRYGIIQGARDERGQSCPFDVARDMDGLRDAVKRIGGVSLLIIDPIVTAVTGDMHKANDVRRSLQTIVDFAAEFDCAVLGITHFAKGTTGKNSVERVIGSQAFAALARMVLAAAKEEDSDRRVFTRAKSNNSVDTGGLAYTIEVLPVSPGIVATRVVWGETLEGSSRSILSEIESEDADQSKKAVAKRFLQEILSNGPVPSNELFEHGRERYGLSKDTLRRAQSDLGVTAVKALFNGGWSWSLPQQPRRP